MSDENDVRLSAEEAKKLIKTIEEVEKEEAAELEATSDKKEE